jgi:hypothetical protein
MELAQIKLRLPRVVYRTIAKESYSAVIKINKKKRYLGTYPTIQGAEKAFLFAYFREYMELPPEYRS